MYRRQTLPHFAQIWLLLFDMFFHHWEQFREQSKTMYVPAVRRSRSIPAESKPWLGSQTAAEARTRRDQQQHPCQAQTCTPDPSSLLVDRCSTFHDVSKGRSHVATSSAPSPNGVADTFTRGCHFTQGKKTVSKSNFSASFAVPPSSPAATVSLLLPYNPK